MENLIYIGTYTKKEGHVDGKAEGIYSVYQNTKNGRLRFGETVAEITNPSFVKVSRDGKNLYAVSELGPKDAESGFVFSYKINEDDSLTEIGKISTEAFAPCHIEIDNTGKFVFVSNYLGGVVMVYHRNKNGILEKKQRLDIADPEISHPHSVTVSPDNKHFYVADLGSDKIFIYDFDSEGNIKPNKMPFLSLEKSSGPRHLCFSKNGNFIYVVNELNNSLKVLEVSTGGELKLLQELSTLPEDFSGKNSAADIHLHPSGRFLYVSNRGHNSIAAYKIEENSGKVELIGFTDTEGEIPRNFAIDPQGKFLYVANQNSNSVTSFNINSKNGILSPNSSVLEIKTPVCVEFSMYPN
ncbi:MAG TPA: lactonase family protein [Salinimicrobium sp.]|nr:lactonase family protein [Salinimicrobium sp.]